MNLDAGEELVETVAGEDGELVAAVTRDDRGELVLNAARLLMVDVGFEPEEKPRTGWTLFTVMFGATAPSSRPDAPPPPLERWLAADPRRGVRLYRTATGFRYLSTAAAPTSEAETDATLAALGAGDDYRARCRALGGFRARLTPRPAACGIAPMTVPFPRGDAERQARFASWLAAYESKRARFATCRFVGALGRAELDPGLEALIALHDERTAAHSDLPLA